MEERRVSSCERVKRVVICSRVACACANGPAPAAAVRCAIGSTCDAPSKRARATAHRKPSVHARDWHSSVRLADKLRTVVHRQGASHGGTRDSPTSKMNACAGRSRSVEPSPRGEGLKYDLMRFSCQYSRSMSLRWIRGGTYRPLELVRPPLLCSPSCDQHESRGAHLWPRHHPTQNPERKGARKSDSTDEKGNR